MLLCTRSRFAYNTEVWELPYIINSIGVAKYIWYVNKGESCMAFNMIIQICDYWHGQKCPWYITEWEKAGNWIYMILFHGKCVLTWVWACDSEWVSIDMPQRVNSGFSGRLKVTFKFLLIFCLVFGFIIMSMSWFYNNKKYFFTFNWNLFYFIYHNKIMFYQDFLKLFTLLALAGQVRAEYY